MTYRHLPVVLAALAVVLTVPSLWQGWVADDLIQRQMLLTEPLPALLKGLFVFASPDKNLQQLGLSTDAGTMPWWTLETLRIAFFRPLAVLTHWLDYQLWPDSVLLMRVQSMLWYAGVCALAALLYRRLLGRTWVAGLAAFLFTVDAVHLGSVAWLANRNGLMALFFGMLALLAHDRWRRDGWLAGAVVAPLMLALALLSAETGIAAVAYLFAYSLFLDRATWWRRFLCLAPYVAVLLVWRVVYQGLGYGAWGSGFYIDPGGEPLRFAAGVVERGPILLLSQWIGQIPMPYNLLSQAASRIAWLVALLLLAVLGIALVPLLQGSRTARFSALGMIVAIVPACGISLLSGRLLLFAGLGAMALIAQFAEAVLARGAWSPVYNAWKRPALALCVLLLGLHGVLSPIMLPITAQIPDLFQGGITEVTDIGELPAASAQDVVIVNAPSPFEFIYVPAQRWLDHQAIPAHVRVLAPGYAAVSLTRLDSHTVLVEPEGGYLVPPGTAGGAGLNAMPPLSTVYLFQYCDGFFRGSAFPVTLGQRFELTGMHVAVTALTDDGRPEQARIEFDRTLEDPSLKWLQWSWKNGRYEEVILPANGETVQISGPFADAQASPVDAGL